MGLSHIFFCLPLKLKVTVHVCCKGETRRKAYYMDAYDRCQLPLALKRPRLLLSGKPPLWSLSPKTTVLGKQLPEWRLLLIKCTRSVILLSDKW